MELIVRYEDAELIVVEKPAGIHTAPLRANEEGTLLAAVLERFPEIARVPGFKPVEPGLLHRLDRETSGLVLFARTPECFARLRSEQERGRIEKQYVAVCRAQEGARPERSPTRIESRFAPYGPARRMVRVVNALAERRTPEASAKRGAQAPGEARLGRAASARRYATELEPLERRRELVLVRARLAIGFRHQVRAHLAYLGLPILGDPLYGPGAPDDRARRMLLHAARIELRHPASGAAIVVDSPLPSEFRELFPDIA